MSHHFDYPTDETLDISDAYCFAGATPTALPGPVIDKARARCSG
jgi:hypothetical protein